MILRFIYFFSLFILLTFFKVSFIFYFFLEYKSRYYIKLLKLIQAPSDTFVCSLNFLEKNVANIINLDNILDFLKEINLLIRICFLFF